MLEGPPRGQTTLDVDEAVGPSSPAKHLDPGSAGAPPLAYHNRRCSLFGIGSLILVALKTVHHAPSTERWLIPAGRIIMTTVTIDKAYLDTLLRRYEAFPIAP